MLAGYFRAFELLLLADCRDQSQVSVCIGPGKIVWDEEAQSIHPTDLDPNMG